MNIFEIYYFYNVNKLRESLCKNCYGDEFITLILNFTKQNKLSTIQITYKTMELHYFYYISFKLYYL